MKFENILPQPLKTATQELLIATTGLLSSSTLPPATPERPNRPEQQIVLVSAPQEGGFGGLEKQKPLPKPVEGDPVTEWRMTFDKHLKELGKSDKNAEAKVFHAMVRDPEELKQIKSSATRLLELLDPKNPEDLKGPKETSVIKILNKIIETDDPEKILTPPKSALAGMKRATNLYLLHHGPNAEKEPEEKK